MSDNFFRDNRENLCGNSRDAAIFIRRTSQDGLTCESTFPPGPGDKKYFCCLPETFACLSLQMLSRATNSEVDKLGRATCLLV